MPLGSKRRLRIDEDLKQQWVMGDVLARRSHSAAQSVRSAGLVSTRNPGMTREWEDQLVRRHTVASWENFEAFGVVGISPDGKRVGVPKEETESYGAFSPKASRGASMFPMVSGIQWAEQL